VKTAGHSCCCKSLANWCLPQHVAPPLPLAQYNGTRFVVSLAFALVVGSLYYKKGQVRS